MRLAEPAAHTEEMKNAQELLFRNPEPYIINFTPISKVHMASTLVLLIGGNHKSENVDSL
jgi:hypothetical protein